MELVKVRETPLKSGIPTDGLFIVVGLPKSGKTSFSASFPHSYIIELEKGGADRISGRIHDIDNLVQFRETLKAVVDDTSIKTIVIDTLDVVSDLIEQEIATGAGLENISQTKKGVDGFELWAAFRQRIENLVAYLKVSGKLCILVAHCKEPKTDNNGVLLTQAGINVPGKGGAYIAGQADMIGYAYKKQVGHTTEYYLTFQGGPLGTWGSRVDELNDKTLRIPKVNGYSAFAAAFVPPTPKAIVANSKKTEKVAQEA